MHKKKPFIKRLTKAGIALAAALALATSHNYIAQGQTMYTIQPGDRLSEIAAQYGVSIYDLRAWNNILGDQLEVGAQIYVSEPTETPQEETPTQEPAPAEESPAPAQDGVYVVQSGDNLSSIAARYGVTVGELMAWNNLSSDWLNVGDQIALSGGAVSSGTSVQAENNGTVATTETGYTYTVAPGDTMSYLAIVYGTSVDELIALNGGSDYLVAGQTINVPGAQVVTYDYAPATSSQTYSSGSGATGSYTVQSGDTLSDIAAVYGMSVDELIAVNGLSSDWLNVGDVLVVNSTASTPQASTTPSATQAPDQTQNQAETRRTGFTDKERDPNRRLQQDPYERLPEKNRPKIHKVKEGESVWTIGDDFNVSGRSIMIWNNLQSESDLKVDDEIHVKNPALVPKVADVDAGQDLKAIAKEFDTTVENLVKWNKLTDKEKEDIKEGDLLIASDPELKLHQTKAGETLEEIAKKYNIDIKDLKKWNYIPEDVSIVNGSLVVSNPNGKDKNETPIADQSQKENESSKEESQEESS